MEDTPIAIAAELASAGFADAREVGRGAACVVYSCVQTSLRRKVAVKVLALDTEKQVRELFLLEGHAMGLLLGHPNIVKILQVGVTESNRPYLVMPYYAADSLGLRLRQVGQIQWPEALRIGVKLCGALETAHRTGTLHRDIKPENVLVDDYGEPQLTEFGISHLTGGKGAAYTAPEVLAGSPPTVAADIYSLGATLHALIAGNSAHNSDEELIARYLRISSATVPSMRTKGIPSAVFAPIERAMSHDPAKRPVSAAEFGSELQAAHGYRNGVTVDPVALNGNTSGPNDVLKEIHIRATLPVNITSANGVAGDPRTAPIPQREPESAPLSLSALSLDGLLLPPQKRRRLPMPPATAAAIAVLLLVVFIGAYLAWRSFGPQHSDDRAGNTSEPTVGSDLTVETAPTVAAPPAAWQPISNAPLARAAVASTQADGTIWIFGGIGADGVVSGHNEGYDTPTDAWRGGDDVPVPAVHAMSVTWQGTPVVLGGWQPSGVGGNMLATGRVWRMIEGHWVELPPMLQPRAAGAAAVVGDRIIVTGGVDAGGAMLNTTEIFDGASWIPGAALPTPRLLLAAASDDRLMYAVGGLSGRSEVTSVEAYDPVADTWSVLPSLPQERSDLGVAVAGGRLLAVGGVAAGQVLKSVAVLDLPTLTWSGLPDMGTARHGMAVAAVADSVYAIGGSVGVSDLEATSSAEVLKLPPPLETQPA